MDNTNMVLAANIQKYRKKCGLTQEDLAKKLGVTFQAVSKWENAKTAPDILFLPTMADLFGCSIDELFSREIKTEIHYDLCSELPWNDDEVTRIFQAQGKKIIKADENNSYMEISFPKNCNEITRQYFKVEVFGNIVCDSSINGDVVCHGNINCYEINGDVTTDSIEVRGINGGISTPFPDLSSTEAIKEYITKEVKNKLDTNGSTSKLLSIMVENIDGSFELTDENIERLLDAYRDLYRGLPKEARGLTKSVVFPINNNN